MPDKVTKPQSPIMNGDEGVYPLTTFDQIIMADGSRWNGKVLGDAENAVTMEVDGTETDQLVPINAQTIDGLTYKQIIDLEHGVGSFYFTLSAADDPNTKWNWMTWELVTDKFLLGAGLSYEVGTEGGEAEHVLTVNEMPKHSHVIQHNNDDYNNSAGGGSYGFTHDGASTFLQASTLILPTGGDQPHNNMPPYLSIFMWTRTA